MPDRAAPDHHPDPDPLLIRHHGRFRLDGLAVGKQSGVLRMNHTEMLAQLRDCPEFSPQIREAAAWALERLAEPPAVTVKPLVWDGDARWPGTAWAGGYQINEEDEEAWLMVDPQGNISMFDTLKAAKAAAQADYAARILPAIDARPASAVRDEVLEEAARQVRYSAPRAWFSVDVDRVMAAIRALKGGEA